jgi:DNA polymerase III gamma/tau subunit
LERITKGEKLSAESDALEEIASLSDGSFRDGAKILEEISVDGKGRKITKKLIGEYFKTTTLGSQLTNLVTALFAKDTKTAISAISQMVEEGSDIKLIMDQLINKLHDELIKGVEGGKQNIPVSELANLINLLTRAYGELRFSPLPQIPLEIAVIEWGESTTLEPTQRKEQGSGETFKSPGKNDKILKELIDEVKTNNFSLAGVLRGSVIEKMDDKSLVISTMYQFHKEKLEEGSARKLIEEVASKVIGKGIKVSFLLKHRGGDLNE